MEVTALCITLLVNLLMLLVAHVQQSSPQKTVSNAALHIIPTRLQVFEYESVSFTCERGDGLKVRNIMKIIPECSINSLTSTSNCTIEVAYKSDSGEYWCEGGGGERSNTVNITVTDGSVILESPILPVTEGEDVTLSCRKRNTSSNRLADFYKDGLHVGSSSTGEMIIHRVSKSDEGLYKCNISGAGESPESWLSVREILESPAPPVMEGDDVTVCCRSTSNLTSNLTSNITADFYEGGIHIGNNSTAEMTINNVSKSDEGLYKHNNSDAGDSPESWLAVRDGPVILESPALPVMEAGAVTLKCRNKQTSSNLTADFYREGLLIRSSSTGEMTIHRVSKSDEGLYKCRMSGAGESPESWLAVRASDAAVIVPTRLQIFEYESVSFTCLGVIVSAGWKVRNANKFLKTCSNVTVTSTLTCTIGFALGPDSGEYWCEGGGGERSNTVNITVTDGPVVLESPVLPVMDGEDVTLSCRKNKTSSNTTADFYKDGLHVGSSSTGEMTIHGVSKSDEGLYMCNISGAGESPESWLAVRDGSVILESPVLPVVERDAVTLSCRKRNTSSNLPADFYKNGHFLGSSSTGEMTIHRVSKSDEGLYKCSISGAGESPESWLAVRDGSVILESPALPVMEAGAVTLKCRNKQTSSNHTADFYREGLLIRSSSTGEMIIHRVSKSDEGLYKCRMSGAGESPESWLAVRDLHRVTCFSLDHPFCLLLLVRTVFTILIVAVLLPVVVLLHCGKLRVTLT